MAEGCLTRVLVTGADGQLGSAFVERLSEATAVRGIDVGSLDITEPATVRRFVAAFRPTLILNCAAFTDVDGAERQPLAAYRVNAEAVLTLALAAEDAGAVFVHYSTDFVHDGCQARPYTEDDEPRPQSMYGVTKLVGERYAGAASRRYVLRLSSLYGGRHRRTSVDWMIRQAQAGERIPAFVDRTVSPSYVPDVVEVTLRLLGGPAPFGLYNCGSADWCTWADIASRVLARWQRHELLDPKPFADVPGRASRPKNCALSSQRLMAAGASPRTWARALDDYLDRSLQGPAVEGSGS